VPLHIHARDATAVRRGQSLHLSFAPQSLSLGSTLPRGLAIFALRNPSRRAARQDADHRRQNQDEKERRGNCEGCDIAFDERVEGDRDDLSVREGEDQQQDRNWRKDEEFEKVLHVRFLKIIVTLNPCTPAIVGPSIAKEMDRRARRSNV
jgi:hypothetical protein